MKIDLDINTLDLTTCYDITDNEYKFTGTACLSKDRKWIYLILPSICFYKIQRTYKIVEMLKNRFKVGRKIQLLPEKKIQLLPLGSYADCREAINYWTKYKNLLIEVNEEKAYKLFTLSSLPPVYFQSKL